MSGFPWGWLLISAGASLIYSDKVTKWFERKRRADVMLAYLNEHGAVDVSEEDLAYLDSHPVHASILLAQRKEQEQHPDHLVTPAVSCSSSTPSGSEEEEEADDEEEEDGVASADSADESE